MSNDTESVVQELSDILSGKTATQAAETVALVKALQAVEMLSQSGFEEDAKIVVEALKGVSLTKEASAVRTEEVIIEVTG